MHGIVAFALMLALGSSSHAVEAQDWLPDRVRTEGEGFRTDRVEIHPSFAAEVGFDSNIFLEDTSPDRAALMRLTGAVFLQPRRRDGDATGEVDSTREVRRLDFNLGLRASYYHFFTNAAQGNVAGQFNAGLRVRPEGRVGFELRETFERTVRPFTDAARGTSASYSYGRNQNLTTAALTFQSRGGVLRGHVSYGADLGFFDSSLFRANNTIRHDVGFRLAWTFFPRTALVHETLASFNRYGLGGSPNPFAALESSRRIESTVGVNGVLTPKLAATLSLGYAAGFFDAGDEYDGPLVRAELRYLPKPSIRLALGYQHDYQLSYIGNFLRRDVGYANAEMAFAGRFVTGARLSFSYQQTGDAFLADGATPLGNFVARYDYRTQFSAYFEYRATSWLAITTNAEYQNDTTPFVFNTPAGAGSALPDPSAAFQRFDVWVGARVYH